MYFIFFFSRRLQDVLKTFWSRRMYFPCSYVFRRFLQDVLIKTNIFVLVMHLQDIFKMFSRRLAKASSRHLQDVFKTSSRRLTKMSSRHLPDAFKTYNQVKLLLLTRLQDEIFNMFLRRIAKTIIYIKIFPGHTSEKFMVDVQNFQEWTLWIYRNF